MTTLYSGSTCPFSQRCRIVLLEKGLDFTVINVDLFNKPKEIVAINPYNQVPILVDRELEIFESNIINEYIEDRFPHPQLIPADSATRARTRLYLHRFEQELFAHVKTLDHGNTSQKNTARATIRDQLTQIAPIFSKQKFLLGDEFSILDVALSPLLWRLDHYQIQISKKDSPLLEYAERVFSRPSFRDSLTAEERAMHDVS